MEDCYPNLNDFLIILFVYHCTLSISKFPLMVLNNNHYQGKTFLLNVYLDRTTQKKGLFSTLLQMLKIGKIHPAMLILKSQTIVGLNLLEIADKNPQQLQNALIELITLLDNKIINPVAANEFSWEQISKAHFGMENALFTGKIYVNILD